MRCRSATAFVKMNAQALSLVFLQALLVALATGFSFDGSIDLGGDWLSSQGELVIPLPKFPDVIGRLPGMNSTGGLPKIPKLSDLVPKIPAIRDPSSVLLPRIPQLPSISDIANSPDLAAALEKARKVTAAAIGGGSDLISGINKAMEKAIRSINPTQAFRSLVGTILNSYQAVARSCPAIAVGIKVLTEGIRLSVEVAKSIRNIIST